VRRDSLSCEWLALEVAGDRKSRCPRCGTAKRNPPRRLRVRLSIYNAPSSNRANVKSIPFLLDRELTLAGREAERHVGSKPQVHTPHRCVIDRLKHDLRVGMAKS